MTDDVPANLRELFEFYYRHVKPLYCEVQASGSLHVEVLFEINAAFDHISRITYYGEDEGKAVRQACGHLKRSCLDIVKIWLRETGDEYHELKPIAGIIDNGRFEREMVQLFSEIRTRAVEARRLEGDTSRDHLGHVAAFDRWKVVHEMCVDFHARFYLHSQVEWARKHQRRRQVKERLIDGFIGLAVGVAASVLATLLYQWFGP